MFTWTKIHRGFIFCKFISLYLLMFWHLYTKKDKNKSIRRAAQIELSALLTLMFISFFCLVPITTASPSEKPGRFQVKEFRLLYLSNNVLPRVLSFYRHPYHVSNCSVIPSCDLYTDSRQTLSYLKLNNNKINYRSHSHFTTHTNSRI